MNNKEALYRHFETDLYPLSKGSVLAFNKFNDLINIYPEEIVKVLLSCKDFRSLDNHALSYIYRKQHVALTQSNNSLGKKVVKYIETKLNTYGEKIPISEKEFLSVKHQLQDLVKNKLLVSEHELKKRVIEAVNSCETTEEIPKKIKVLGIPTRNRSKLLRRCLQSYVKNLHHKHRTSQFHIVDGSDNVQKSHKNKQFVNSLLKKHNTNFLWADHHFCYLLSKSIAQTTKIPEKIVSFALLGDSRCTVRTGASRNTLLLLSVGQPSVQVDDDTLCRIVSTPGIEDGLALSSKGDCNEYWWQNHLIKSGKQKKVKEQDFFSFHESLLCNHPATLIRKYDKLNIEQLNKELLEQIHDSESNIAVSYMGAYGDSGMLRHWPYLCMINNSFKRLVENNYKYKEILCSRQIFRGVSQKTIGTGSFCMAMNIGLDTSKLLPPFMPVQRNQDGIFGQLLHLCFKKAFKGYSPNAVHHDPPDRDAQTTKSQALSVGPLQTPNVIEAFLWRFYKWPFGSDPACNLKMVGQYLFDLSQLSCQQFKIEAWDHCKQMIHSRIRYLEERLDQEWDAPDFWKNDVRQVISNFQNLMQLKNMGIPCDIPGNDLERLTIFKEIVGKFGQLLIHWPAIWNTAKELQKHGKFKEIENKSSL